MSSLAECVCLAGHSSSHQCPVGDFEYPTTYCSVPVFLCFLEQQGGTSVSFGDSGGSLVLAGNAEDTCICVCIYSWPLSLQLQK